MHLLDHTADAGAIVTNDDEQVLGDESHFLTCRYDLYMSKPLLVGAHLILTLHDENATFTQDAVCLLRPVVIKLKDRLMILALRPVARSIVPVMLLELVVNRVRGPAWRVHVGRVEDNAIQRAVPIGKRAAVHPVLEIGSKQFILAIRDVSPKHSLAIRDVGYLAAWFYVQPENLGENGVVSLDIRGENQIVRRLAVLDLTPWFSQRHCDAFYSVVGSQMPSVRKGIVTH